MVTPHVKISAKGRKALAEKFNVDPGNLTRALSYQIHSTRAREIRCHAINIMKFDAVIDRHKVF